MSGIVELLLGSGAVLGAALGGALVGLAVVLFLPRLLFVLGQVIFGLREPDNKSGYVYPPAWYQKATFALPIIMAPVPVIVLMVLLFVVYPPARIPFMALSGVLVVLAVFWIVKYRQKRKQQEEQSEKKEAEELKEGKERWRREHGLLP
jgi:hypothetical protein